MYKIIGGTTILSVIAITITTIAADPKIVYPATVKPEEVDSLNSLSPEHALPFILFKGDDKIPYHIPMGLTQAEIKDNRLASGTIFYAIPPRKQLFFCPDPNVNQSPVVLLAMEFEKSQVLQCEHESKAIALPNEDNERCGKKESILIEFNYRVVFGDGTKTAPIKTFTTYKFCFNEEEKKVEYVEYKTISANLLSEKLLQREREIKYQGNPERRIFINNGKLFRMKLGTKAENYEFQKLLPPEYMALYSWRKTTYHNANIDLQHKTLIPLWKEINEYINTNAMQTSHLPRTIITGVIDIPSERLSAIRQLLDGSEILNMWVTLVMDLNIETEYKGLAILMYNFIPNKSDSQRRNISTVEQAEREYIDELCGENLCVDSLKQKFEAVGGEMRCCKATEKIKQLFYRREEDYKPIDEVLQIHNITYSV